jgi:hypothetical protein
MPMWIAGGLLVLSVALATGPAVKADQPTFADLLARAQAEAEAGHRWGPPGDNLADTIMMLFQLAPTATPDQLAAFADLLERDRKNLQQSPVVAPPSAEPPGAEPPVAATPPAADGAPVAGPAPTVEAPPPVAAPPRREVPAAAAIPPAAPAPAAETPPRAAAPARAAEMPPPVVAPPRHPNPAIAALPPAGAPPPAATPPPHQEPTVVALPPAAAPPPAATPPPAAAASPPAGAATNLAAPAPARRPMLRLPDPHADALFARGKAAEEQGDISGARRFYAAAAERGHAAAARNVGRLYDPAVLNRIAVGGIDANPALAKQWYLRAAELGDQDAKPLLQALTTR